MTIVDQGGGKWRLCHDYSVGTNRYVSTSPFDLCDVWDVKQVMQETSYMAKYDIRDGFWNCPIAESSRKRLVVRHPGTGRLMWANKLPFGFLDSPRLFCGVTEASASDGKPIIPRSVRRGLASLASSSDSLSDSLLDSR